MAAITETSNELTVDLDLVGPRGILQLLRVSDAQLFSGYKSHSSVYDSEVITTLTSLIRCSVASFTSSTSSTSLSSRSRVRVVFSGAGTSGRIANIVSHALQPYANNKVEFHYLIAGGDKALIVGQEGSEDNVNEAVVDLKGIIGEGENAAETIIYVGITCGFSAPYVAAQLDYLFKLADANTTRVISVLMGFNPIDLARKNVIEHWHRSFSDVTLEMVKRSNSSDGKNQFFIINPVVGPEPLTGSTRMKGGTITKILLEVIFSVVCHQSFSTPLVGINTSSDDIPSLLVALFGLYERTYRETYLKLDKIAPLVQNSGNALQGGKGHVYYVGGHTLGMLAFIDASETVPTFGASYKEVRAFILDYKDGSDTKNAWAVLGNKEGDLSSYGPQYTITQTYFEESIEPTINEHDFVVLFYNSFQPTPYTFDIAQRIKKSKPKTKVALVYFGACTSKEANEASAVVDNVVVLDLPFKELLPGLYSFIEISTKWILNAISTGGFVLQGKVFENRMIDLGISNHKLFHRATGIVSKFGKVDINTSTHHLLRAIYSLDPQVEVPADILNAPISDHVRKVSSEAQNGYTKIVATALLLCTGKFTVASAKQALSSDPIVRNILLQHGLGN